MEPLDNGALQSFLNAASILQGSGSGRALQYGARVARTIVVQLVADDFPDHARAVLHTILGSADSWVLIARYGHVPIDLLLATHAPVSAVTFAAAEADHVAAFLASHGPPTVSGGNDVYLIARDGRMFLTWDHHWDEGIDVGCVDVQRASVLLTALNELGTELELYSTGSPHD
jgi:hypothetical protein